MSAQAFHRIIGSNLDLRLCASLDHICFCCQTQCPSRADKFHDQILERGIPNSNKDLGEFHQFLSNMRADIQVLEDDVDFIQNRYVTTSPCLSGKAGRVL